MREEPNLVSLLDKKNNLKFLWVTYSMFPLGLKTSQLWLKNAFKSCDFLKESFSLTRGAFKLIGRFFSCLVVLWKSLLCLYAEPQPIALVVVKKNLLHVVKFNKFKLSLSINKDCNI